jgi:hypothetical protein
MVEAIIRTRAEITREPRSPNPPDETVLFVAALAAALAEHQRHAGEANSLAEPADSRANWKVVARLERLRGRG